MRFKNVFFVLVCLWMYHSSFGQSKNNTAYVNLGGQGVETSFKTRLTYDIHFEAFAGIGAGYSLDETSGYNYEYGFIPFTKANLKWHFVNEEDRTFYLATQAKYSFGKTSDSSYNQVLITEGHIGNEQYITPRLIFNIHVGGGYIQDFDVKRGEFLFTFGVTLKYAIIRF